MSDSDCEDPTLARHLKIEEIANRQLWEDNEKQVAHSRGDIAWLLDEVKRLKVSERSAHIKIGRQFEDKVKRCLELEEAKDLIAKLKDKVELWKFRCAQRDQQLEFIHQELDEIRGFLLQDKMGVYDDGGSLPGSRDRDRDKALDVANKFSSRWYRHHYHGESTTRLQERIKEQRREIVRLLGVTCGE